MVEQRRGAPEVVGVLRALRGVAPDGPGDHTSEGGMCTGDVRHVSQTIERLVGTDGLAPRLASLVGELKRQVGALAHDVRSREVGTVQHVGSGVATLSGLSQTRTNELVRFSTGIDGMVLNLERRSLDVILLGSSEGIQGGDLVTATGRTLQVPVGHDMLGRVVDPLGRPLDARRPVEATQSWNIEREAASIVDRAPVGQPLLTGWKMIDALVPIGRGQRELILGDRQTGKTTLVLDTILNQRDHDVICFYVAIGQKKSSTLATVEALRAAGALAHTTVVISSADDPPALRYLAPFAACTMAEFHMLEGRDVLIVYDDLTRHADAYRELSLLLRRAPGREAYPGDVFYLHSRLLERACKLSEAAGGGSLTALPVAETQQGNLSSYIPTNLVSITDGQIILDTDLFNQGVKPAIDAGTSVSRVGGAAQVPAMRRQVSSLRLELAQFEEVRRFARFGTEVDEATQQQIRRGERWQALLTQAPHDPLSQGETLLMLQAANQGYLDAVPIQEIPAFERGFTAMFRTQHPAMMAALDRSGDAGAEFPEAFEAAATRYRGSFLKGEAR
ncbi:MAG: F0F1 ATP synthase subunit alpha [Anaerolineae bacterium]|jgi:F-type H+-transporting ATPase subunit alpha|nr:F0F1 ATP synthase subunit alpha [Anaerolineae bacterium]